MLLAKLKFFSTMAENYWFSIGDSWMIIGFKKALLSKEKNIYLLRTTTSTLAMLIHVFTFNWHVKDLNFSKIIFLIFSFFLWVFEICCLFLYLFISNHLLLSSYVFFIVNNIFTRIFLILKPDKHALLCIDDEWIMLDRKELFSN